MSTPSKNFGWRSPDDQQFPTYLAVASLFAHMDESIAGMIAASAWRVTQPISWFSENSVALTAVSWAVVSDAPGGACQGSFTIARSDAVARFILHDHMQLRTLFSVGQTPATNLQIFPINSPGLSWLLMGGSGWAVVGGTSHVPFTATVTASLGQGAYGIQVVHVNAGLRGKSRIKLFVEEARQG